MVALRSAYEATGKVVAGVGGRTAIHDLREIFNAILYVNRTGFAGLYLPHDLPPWQSVYGYFTAWTNDGIFTDLNYDLNGLVRTKSGRSTTPTGSIMDTQSVKTSTNVPTATQGIDAGKRIVNLSIVRPWVSSSTAPMAPNGSSCQSLLPEPAGLGLRTLVTPAWSAE